MNLVHTAVCGALVAALEWSAGPTTTLAGAGDLWRVPQAPASSREPAPDKAATDARQNGAETPRSGSSALTRWLTHSPNDNPASSPSAVPFKLPSPGAANKSPQASWNQRIAQWRLARIEKVREQLLKQAGGTGDPVSHAASPSGPVLSARSGPADGLQPPQIEFGAPGAPSASAATIGAAPTAPQANEPSHEVNIDLPDLTDGPKPKSSLSSRLRGGR